MNRPGGPTAGMIPVGNIHFTSPTHSAFIPPCRWATNNGARVCQQRRLSLASTRLRKRRKPRPIKYPYYVFMATAPHQPCPSLVHLQRQRLLLPRNVARMACSEVAWPAMTERLRGAGPRPRIILSQITILDGGASLLATGGSGSPKSAAAAERDIQTSSQCLSRSGVGVRPPDMSPAPVCLVWPVV